MQDRNQEAENSENSNPNTLVMPLPEKTRFGDATNAPHSGPAEPASRKLPTDPNQVILEGFLMKETKGSFLKTFQKRWCVLKYGLLEYFHKKTDKVAASSIPLSSLLGVHVDSTKNTHSLIVTCRDRVYKFVQPDKVTTFKWLQAITEATPQGLQ